MNKKQYLLQEQKQLHEQLMKDNENFECNGNKSKPKKHWLQKKVVFVGEWKEGLPTHSENYFVDFKNFQNFFFDNIFETSKCLIFKEDNLFIGELNMNRQFHGKGSCFYENEFVYRGYFKNGVWHNKGQIFYKNIKIYNGDFYEGEIQGFGQLQKSNGNVYIGQFHKETLQGFGQIMMSNGSLFEGNFLKGLKQGKGKITYPDKKVLEGIYDQGKLEGNAILSKIDTFGKMVYFKRKYKKGKLKSECVVYKKPKISKACCLKFTF